MELDLITGPLKPKIAVAAKTAVAKGPALGLATLPEADFPEFTALLEAGLPTAPSKEEPLLTAKTELPVQLSMAIPQDYFPSAKAAPEDAPETKLETVSEPETQPEKSPIAIGVALPSAIAIPPLPSVGKPTEPDLKTPEAKLPPVAEAATRIAIPTEVKQGQTLAPPLPALPIPSAPVERAKPETMLKIPPSLPQPILATKASSAISPAISNAPLAPPQTALASLIATPEMAPTPDETQTGPVIRIAPKSMAPPQAPPTPLASFANAEVQPLTDDPAELQFGIKIERQAVELPQSMRLAPPAAPVANQIAAQLPQLITKADKQTIELRLDPPELGRVVIQLTTQDTQVTAQIFADRADTVDLMRRHADLLTATLARAGFSDSSLSFQQGQNQGKERGFTPFQTVSNAPDSLEQALAPTTSIGLDGRLDIRL